MPKRVPVIAPDGKRGTVPEEKLAKAEAAGFRLPTEREAVGVEAAQRPAAALGRAVGRGVTLGLSDLGQVDPEGTAALKEENPIASAVGEVAGAVASPVSMVGGGVARLAGGGLGGAVARGAAETSLFGLGQVISEEGLGDHQTNVEKLAAIAGGGVFGAGLGGFSHGVGLAGSALVKKLGGVALSQNLSGMAGAFAGRAASRATSAATGLPFVGPAVGNAVRGAVASNAFVGAAAQKLASSPVVAAIGKNLKRVIEKLGDDGMLGAYRTALENAGAQGVEALLSTHVKLAQEDPMYLPTLGMTHEEGDAANQYAQKAEALGALQAALASHDAEVDTHAARFLGQAPGRPPKAKYEKFDGKRFNGVMESVNKVLRAPDATGAEGLAGTAPMLAMDAAAQARRAAEFLLAKAPKNPGVKGLAAFAMPWEPSQADLSKFGRYVRAVENPMVVLADLTKNGHVDPAAAEVMRTVYPKLLANYQEKMMDRLREYDKPLPYAQKRALDSLFGSEFRGGNPTHLALLQQMHADNMAKKSGPSKDGRQTQSQEDNLKTQAQRLEGR